MYKTLFILGLCFILFGNVNSKVIRITRKVDMKDVIGFPEIEENYKLRNRKNRQPLYLPAICPVNELYYPGDQDGDWICDCRSAYLYHPKTAICWAAWQRGPCQEGQYLVLHDDSPVPVCEPNPCKLDGFVQYRGRCERLGSSSPCKDKEPSVAALGVNGTTLEIDCLIIRAIGTTERNTI